MKGYKVPTENAAAELVEKKSRFIGHVFKVESAEQAAEIIKSHSKKYWDASHNVYAYILKDSVMRFSDDGEPSGTAGMPTLEVLKKEEIFDVLAITTRYFGGTLLGAGGLVRAYAASCKLALDTAGVSMMTPYVSAKLVCPYNLLEPLRRQFAPFEAEETNCQFTDEVAIDVALPHEKMDDFSAHIFNFSAGKVKALQTGEMLFAKKLK